MSEVTTRKVRDIVIVDLPAKIDAGTAASFNEKVEWALADTPGVVIVNFAPVKQSEPAGVKALDFLFLRTQEVDIPVVLAGADDAIRKLLDDAGYLKQAAGTAASVDEALDSDMV